MRIEGAVDLLGSGLGLDEDVGHAFTVLRLSARVQLHCSRCDCRAWGRVAILAVKMCKVNSAPAG